MALMGQARQALKPAVHLFFCGLILLVMPSECPGMVSFIRGQPSGYSWYFFWTIAAQPAQHQLLMRLMPTHETVKGALLPRNVRWPK